MAKKAEVAVGQPGPAVAENSMAAHVAMAHRHANGAVTAAATGAVALAHHWARCSSVCGISTTRVEATRQAT
jgi:hypothetical protein